MDKHYELTVYLVAHEDGRSIAHSIAGATFTKPGDMLEYCATFDTEEYEFLFDMWSEHTGQMNINENVEIYKELMGV